MQKVKEGIMHALFLICACVSILAVVLICVYLFASGVPAIGEIGVTDFLACFNSCSAQSGSPPADTTGYSR